MTMNAREIANFPDIDLQNLGSGVPEWKLMLSQPLRKTIRD
jgi:hypothetical protein